MSITATHTEIDIKARERFLEEIDGYAGIPAVQSITKVQCLKSRVSDFRSGKKGARDHVRSVVHNEADKIRNATGHVLAFYLTVKELGYQGTMSTQEVVARAVEDATGCNCCVRTLQRAEKVLVRIGMLHVKKIPTGSRRFIEGSDRSPDAWRTLQINKVTVTPAATLLVLRKPAGPLLRIEKNDTSPPTTFSRSTVGDKSREFPKELSTPCQNDLKTVESSPGRRGVSVESNKLDGSTCPASSMSPQTGKHRTSRSASRKAASRSAAAPVSARKARNKTPRTWDASRKMLIADLFTYLKNVPGRETMISIVQLQTDRAFPAACMSALDWDEWIWQWHGLTWHDRRRAMKNKITPPLEAFVSHLIPPDTTQLHDPAASDELRAEILEQLQLHKRLSDWMQVIPAVIPQGVPGGIREQLEKERWRLNTLVRMIHSGRIALDKLTKKDHVLLKQAADIAGI